MPKSNSRIQKNSGVYTCDCCGHLTRDTGAGEGGSRVCAYCYETGGWENSLSDGDCTQDEFDTAILELQNRYHRDVNGKHVKGGR